MRLHRQAREFYTLTITTSPQISGVWEASFDGGDTWSAGQATADGAWRWLLRGPDRPDDPQYPAQVVTCSVKPLVRAVDIPELVVRSAPYVSII